MYMSRKALSLSASTFRYLNLDAPAGGWGHYFRNPTQTPFRDYNFPAKARSFSIGGTGNYPGAIGLEQSMNIVHQIGIKNVEKRVLELSRLLKRKLHTLNVHVTSAENDEALSGITMFSINNDPNQDLACLNHLLNERILVSVRYTNGHGGIRASTHYYNNEEDIDRLCHTVKTFIGPSKNIFLSDAPSSVS
ncbi:MAG: Aminotransferase class-V [bacterium ADurb.BinA186]|nr:MAG: Aminotransferase class-V [bacterium ADurb.BinA186]